MICKDRMARPKKMPKGDKISILPNQKRNGRGYYIRMPKSTSVDFVKKCREIEPVELHNSTASSGTKKKRGVLAWLKGL